ncbi:FG-GAP-like repeat-containing protein [Ruegeria sp. PrR005]|uniref:Calcium-binding protein n=1 Tax=Ruegeria sp. PrR005 TaxID=2706882 RepID=A0A6B2NT56_9RHOB|nr:FG-GAP-like repeat-containing protein [Ruegeria sp. PrR005]NDW45777.1 hypothetical protein [Ruegeria sp. PrR005]
MFTYLSDFYFERNYNYAGWAQVTDLDRDGLPEIVVTRFSVPGGEWLDMPVFTVHADGTIEDISARIGGGTPLQVDFGRGLIVQDLNGDGWDDIFVADHGLDTHPFPGQVNTVLISDGSGGWINRSAEYSREPDFTHSAAAGDLNGDGLTDIFVGNLGVNGAYIVTVQPDGSPTIGALRLPGIRDYTSSEIADLDGDGIDELILGADQGFQAGLTNKIARYNGSGFVMTALPNQTVLDQSITLDIEVLDLNGDDRPDIVTLVTDADPFYTRIGIQVLIQQSDGSFRDTTTDWFDPTDFAGEIDPNGWASRLIFSDLDLDGDQDLLVQMQFPNKHRIFYQEDGRFSPGPDDQTIGGSNEALALVDFDGDGVDEIMAFTGHGVWIHDNGLSLVPVDQTGGPENDTLTGNAGADTLDGLAGDDVLQGQAGNDRLLGDTGNDSLDGGLGADTLNGGVGDDILIGGPATGDLRDIIFAGEGNDSIDAGAGNDLVYGQGGNDTIAGGFGVDELQGQDGDDVITGSAFSDLVYGGAGSDFVNGGFGHDRINGGTGADKFFHIGAEGHGSDWVQDYSAGEGDVLLFGISSATRADFQVNYAHTANAAGERAGDDAVSEAFVIYRPTGQIMWALVDGEGQDRINLQIGSDVFDLLS